MEPCTIFLIIHASFGTIALLTGFIEALVKKHNLTEKIFLISSLISLIAGFCMIRCIKDDLIIQTSFFILSTLWLAFTLMLLSNIIKKNKKEARKWFIRIFALILFFFTMRIWRIGFILTGIDAKTSYELASWLGWIINILF